MKFTNYLLLIILSAVFILSGPLNASGRLNIAVINFSLYNTPERIGNIFRSKIEYEFYNAKRFNLLERNRLEILEQEMKLSGEKEGTSGYGITMGKLLKADYVVTGTITFNGTYHLNIILADVNSGLILYTRNETFNDENLLYASCRRLSLEMIAALQAGYDNIVISGEKDNSGQSFWNYTFAAGAIPGAPRLNPLLHTGIFITAGAGRMFTGSGIYTGINAGYYHFYISDKNGYAILVPVQASLSYVNVISGKIIVTPSVSAGTAFVYLTDGDTGNNAFEPFAAAALSTGYRITADSAIFVSAFYNMLFEEDGMVDFISFSAGVSNSF